MSELIDIRKHLGYIDKTFITDENVRSIYLGLNATNTNTNTNTFIHYLTNYNTFSSTLFSAITVNPTLLGQIKVKAKVGSSSWNSLTSVPALYKTATNPTAINTQINGGDRRSFEDSYHISFKDMSFINQTQRFNDEMGGQMNVLEMLNSFTAAYNLLDTDTFKIFKREGLITVKDYQGNSLTIVSPTKPPNGYTSTGNTIIVNRVLRLSGIESDTTVARIDAIRRLYLAYIYIIEIYIALYMYDKDTNKATDFSTKNILETCVKKFIKLNEEIYNTSAQDGVGKLYDGLEQRMQDYKTSKVQINSLASDINNLKTDIRIEQNTINSHSSYLKNNQIIFYLFTVIFLVILGLLISTYYSEVTSTAKQFTLLLITAASIVVFVMLALVNTYIIVEPFNSIPSVDLYSTITIQVFNEYLSHTINVLRIIDTYRSYGEISSSINKEKNFYTNVSNELHLNKQNLSAVQAEKLRQGKVLRYRTILFIQILVTVSILMLLLSYQYNVLYIVIAGFVTLLWVYFYIFNVNNLVHTDSRKLYWEQPSMT